MAAAGGTALRTPLRTVGLTALGIAICLACHLILPPDRPAAPAPGRLQVTLVTFLTVAGLTFGFVVSAARWRLAVLYGLLAGVVVAAVVNQGGTGGLGDVDTWRLASALLAVAISAPLLLAWSEPVGPLRPRRPDYALAHDQAWTCLVLLAGALVFLGLVWAMTWLLAGLFDLIGIDLLKRLLDRRLPGLMLTGGALGAGIGLLRARAGLLGTLRGVVTTVLAVLAPLFAIGLLLFLLALPVTGLQPLWQATKATTPILLLCVLGALTLANAVVADADAEMSASRLLRLSAPLLLAATLPLAVIAAVSVGLRLAQYGLTPDRLWALTFVVIASGYGVAAVAALALGRRTAWAARLRDANLNLAFALCGLALLLSTPLIDFNTLSVNSQLARLERGAVPPEKFDWAAMRFDFGEPGRRALKRLAATGAPAVREQAAAALKIIERYELRTVDDAKRRARTGAVAIATLPTGAAIPPALHTSVTLFTDCFQQIACVLVFEPSNSVLAIGLGIERWSGNQTRLVRNQAGEWTPESQPPVVRPADPAERRRAEAALRAAVLAGQIEMRPAAARRQLYVNGKPVGEAFEGPDTPSR